MLKELEHISTEIKFSNPYWQYGFDKYRMPDGADGEYHYVHSRGSTIVIPMKSDNSFVLLRQYRYLNRKISLEFPGGGVAPHTAAQANAAKELEEEAGLRADTLRLIGTVNPYNGVTNEICSIFLATSLIPSDVRPDASEEFELVELTADEIKNNIRSGEIWDGMSITAWYLYTLTLR